MSRLHIAVSASFLTGRAAEATPYNGRPLVYAEQSMLDWLVAAGTVPSIVASLGPRPTDVTYDDMMACFDALVLQGGVDVSPTMYREQPRHPDWAGDRARDDYEVGLLRAAMRANKPVLGICRGHQLINVALGGTLHQDIDTDVPGAIHHRNSELYEKNHHAVAFAPGRLLHRSYGVTTATVNSVHHQAIKDLAADLVVLASAVDDDLVEAVRLPEESHDDPWVVGVQWHPEFQDPSDPALLPTAPLVDAFFAAIRARS